MASKSQKPVPRGTVAHPNAFMRAKKLSGTAVKKSTKPVITKGNFGKGGGY